MSVTKALLIAGGVAVGAYVLLEVVRPARSAATPGSGTPASNTNTVFTSLLNFGTALVNQLGSSGGNSYGSGTQGSSKPSTSTTQYYSPNTANSTVYV